MRVCVLYVSVCLCMYCVRVRTEKNLSKNKPNKAAAASPQSDVDGRASNTEILFSQISQCIISFTKNKVNGV